MIQPGEPESNSASAQGRPRPDVAGFLSLVVPGLGQLYAGAPLRGVALFLIALMGIGGLADFFTASECGPPFQYPLRDASGNVIETRTGYRCWNSYPWKIGAPAALVFLAAWLGGVWHARRFAAARDRWPPLYAFLFRHRVGHGIAAARTELVMAAIFGGLLWLLYVLPRIPHGWPEPPRYWPLYEIGSVFYAAAFQFLAHLLRRMELRNLERLRIAGFFVLALLATAMLLLWGKFAAPGWMLALLIALPSCWQSLHERGDAAAALQFARFFICIATLLLAYLLTGPISWLIGRAWNWIAYRPFIQAYEAYVFCLLYFLLRAAFEFEVGRRSAASAAV